ncbi:MAG: response regulator [Anaerolineae bacterium]
MKIEKPDKHHLLIVDDTPADVDILLEYLGQVDFEITIAEDGERALELSQAEPPDLILLDVFMPGMDGFETCRRLKANDLTREIPVIFMTALMRREGQLKAFEVGGVDYITKPIEQGEVLSRVKTHLALRHMQKELEAQNAQLQQEIAEHQHMEEALRQAQAELERRVEARTLELKQTNEHLTKQIEERKRVEAALRQSEERYRHLVEYAPDVVYTVSPEATLTSLNPAFEKITGWPCAEWLERPFGPLLHPEDLPVALTVHQQMLQGATIPIFELRIRTRQGGYVVGEFITTPLWHEERVVGVLGIARDITDRKRAEEEIQRRNRELALLNRVIAASVTETEPEAILEKTCRELALAFDVPQAAAALLNAQKTEAVTVAEYLLPGRPSGLGDIIPAADNPSFQYLLRYKTPLVVEDAQTDPRLAAVHDLVQRRGIVSLLLVPLLIDGEVIGSLGLDAIEPRHFSAEEVNLAESVAKQVSGVLARLRLDQERQRLEAQYHQAQKMEAIGRLTGGVAHDFNNILTVILGNCSFILDDLEQGHPLRQDAEQIEKAAERAASLTRQLLAFSRRQVLQPSVLDLNHIVTNIEKMLRRLIGEDIDLVTVLEPQLGPIRADASQIEQVIVNLVVNARDAMPEGGKVTIETANVYLDEEYIRRHIDIVAGPYVMLAVSDTGLGMDAETQARIFEPFYTTKEMGEGTGLGLAMVYGVVNQSGGHIWVYSEVGHGTTFKVYLPRIEASAEDIEPKRAAVEAGRGWETILLVEDEDMVRDLAQRALFNKGYKVLTAKHGEEARQICATYQGPIHLLLTDVVMPGGMSGSQLAKTLVSLRPEMKVLYMSGYTENAIVHHGVLDPGIAFLPKPFVPDDLVYKVREVLETREEANPF